MEETVYLTLDEAAERLKLSYPYVKKLVWMGSIPSIKRGKRRLIDEDYIKDMEGRAVLKTVYPRAGR